MLRVTATVLLATLAISCAEANGGGSAGADSSGSDESSAEASSSESASTGESLPACEYPDGPYGNSVGQYLQADHVLPGLLEGQGERTNVLLGDLRDCDGRTGVDAIWFIEAATTCSSCNAEAPQLDEDLPALREQGIRVVILMIDGRAEDWRAAHGLDEAVVLSDLDATFYAEDGNVFGETPNGTPLNVVVDPRTGLIVDRDLGSYDRQSLFDLAARNR